MSDDAAKLRQLADDATDELAARRLRGVALVLDGMSISAAARAVEMDRPRLSHWAARYCERGLAGLEDRRPKRCPLAGWRLEFLELMARDGHDAAALAGIVAQQLEVEIEPAAVEQIMREKFGLEWHADGWRLAAS